MLILPRYDVSTNILAFQAILKQEFPAEMVFTDMTSGRADELYYNDGNLLIDLEEESDYINTKNI